MGEKSFYDAVVALSDGSRLIGLYIKEETELPRIDNVFYLEEAENAVRAYKIAVEFHDRSEYWKEDKDMYNSSIALRKIWEKKGIHPIKNVRDCSVSYAIPIHSVEELELVIQKETARLRPRDVSD